VESLLLRLAHLENFIAFSPNKSNVVSMRAPEALALVMEPMSEMYVDPVVVLDFQALYPSIVIAYNYCFSTCMGKIAPGQCYPKKYGASFLIDSLTDHHLTNIDELMERGQVTVSPNGVAFIGKSVREGIMPKMLTELLEARIAVKAELTKTLDPMKRKILEARQLGLKYISNVTYGYTAASFSGRMPCVEIADSIVQTGRLTLEQAIKWIHENRDWDAHVVYGDTDSVFVRLPGRSRTEAHRIGKEIAAYVTSRCPSPVKLKFEKVYFPCFLMSKKRYVGFKYEAAEDEEPEFDAKGIETVRRDNCPLVSKVLEKTLKILARTKDLTQVRQYVQRQFQKVLAGGSKNLADFVFSKEVRLGTYAVDRPTSTGRSRYNQAESDGDEQMEDLDPEEGQRPHSAIVSLQKMKADPRAVPQYGERIPYVIVYGTGDHNRLRELVASPEELLKNPMLRINSVYYIVKCLVPVLNRVLSLIGADAALWYAEMPRPTSRPINAAAFIRLGKRNLNQPFLDAFFKSSMCLMCSARHSHEIRINGESVMLCQDCGRPASKLDNIRHLVYRLKSIDDELSAFHQANHHHVGSDGPIANLLELDSPDGIEFCCSVDCPMFWKAIAMRQYELPLRKSIVSALRIFGLEYS
jgi:DNA polymerase zeta